MSNDIATKIAELEATLHMPGLPAAAREAVEQQLRALRGPIAQQQSGGANLGVGNTIGQTGDIVAGDQTRGAVDNQGRINGVAVGVNLGRIVYGRDIEEDERRRLAWYLDSLANKLYHLPLRGLEQRLDQGDGMALPHVYVMLATTCRAEYVRGPAGLIRQFFTDDLLTTFKDEFSPDLVLPSQALFKDSSLFIESYEDFEVILSQALLATQAVHDHPYLILVGDPGGGKSTFVRHLAWALAQRGLDQPGQAPALSGWPDDARSLPLLLPLRALAGAIVAHGERPAVVAAALSAELASAYNVREAEVLVEQALHSGAALMLFDGLDEVPLESVPGRSTDRHTVLRVVREFVQLYPRARVVLTCRTRAFDDGLRDLLGWHVETLAPFTLGQIRHFVPAWYAEQVASRQIDQSQAAPIGQKLIDAITDPARARLCEMAATPLLLTMMALVLYNQGELPRDRPQLYERILDLLLGQWDKVREGQSLAEAVGMPAWESRDFLPLLDRLCYEAHRDVTSPDGRGRLSRGALYIALIDFFKRARAANPGNAALCCLDYFEQRSGLLAADASDTYVLAHLTVLST